MFNNRNGIARFIGATPLHAVLCIRRCLLIGSAGNAQSLHADHQSLGVHHHKHCGEASMLLSNQPAGGSIIVHNTGRLGVDAHLFFKRTDRHRVACSEATLRVGQKFGD